MSEYHKIQTIFKRDPETKFKNLLIGQYSLPEFEFLNDCKWAFTEKVDGTNIRVMFDGENVVFGGRTDRAQIPADLVNKLAERFPRRKLAEVFSGPAVLYGEGYGARIQKGGGNYISDGVDFVLFDVFIGGVWLERKNVEDIARTLDVPVVPIIGYGPLYGTLDSACAWAEAGFKSTWGDFEAEGIVLRPTTELMSRTGHRIITKIKCKDFR